jgi:hypothetical protein
MEIDDDAATRTPFGLIAFAPVDGTTPELVQPLQAATATVPTLSAPWATPALNKEAEAILAAARDAGGTVPLFPPPSDTPTIPVTQIASNENPLGQQAIPPAEIPASSSSTESGTGASQEMETDAGAAKRTAEEDTSDQANAKLPRRAT